ncbi:HNH endonuclease [Corallococcus sp. AB030]|nr:HNH endonuclease [Corallococcus sp. AB030]
MTRPLVQLRFRDSYYYSNIINNVIDHDFDYLVTLDEFFGDSKHAYLARPFKKHSALHQFIEYTISRLLSEDSDNIDLERRQKMAEHYSPEFKEILGFDPTALPINEALNHYGIPHQSFKDWLTESGKTFSTATEDDLDDYQSDLPWNQDAAYQALISKCTDEVFFILFQNRALLLKFNDMVAKYIRETDLEYIDNELREYFASSSTLKRASIPQWVKRAVFFRDRGLCSLCQSDQSGLINIGDAEHYDHVVPLARGGLNDVSNIQLLCSSCNLSKKGGPPKTSDFYEAWYSKDEDP